jgi:cytidylate kinase
MNMDKKQHFVITINRELGSGGRTVGRKLAEKLSVPYYDKLLIQSLQDKYKLSVEEIEKEKGNKHQWLTYLKNAFVAINQNRDELWFYQMVNGEQGDMVTSEEMFKVEQQILKSAAEEQSCVVAGRSGFYVFADHPNHLSIMIQASMEHRIERIMKKQNLTREEAEKVIKHVDQMRENYVKKYTGSSRYDTRNYNLVISMDGKTEDEVVELILNYIG